MIHSGDELTFFFTYCSSPFLDLSTLGAEPKKASMKLMLLGSPPLSAECVEGGMLAMSFFLIKSKVGDGGVDVGECLSY